MGNRGGLQVISGAGVVGHLYSHREGCFVVFLAQDALRQAMADSDSPVAAAHAVYSLFQLFGWAEATLEPVLDLNHPRVVIDCAAGRVRLVEAGTPVADWSFDEFLALTDRELDRAYHRRGRMLASGWRELKEKRDLAGLAPPPSHELPKRPARTVRAKVIPFRALQPAPPS